jgi:hypothetical protein
MEVVFFTAAEMTGAKKIGTITFDKATTKYFSEDEQVLAIYKKVHMTSKFDDNKTLKEMGAHWDGKVKRWYCQAQQTSTFKEFITSDERIYLNIPYVLKDELKKRYDLKFDGEAKKWFITANKMNEELQDFVL